MREITKALKGKSSELNLSTPSRATIYGAMDRLPSPRIRIADLPPEVADVLHNLDPRGEVPAHQLAFACFDRGGARAVSYASGLPWLALHQAARMPGWRPRSRGLLEAAMKVRGIS